MARVKARTTGRHRAGAETNQGRDSDSGDPHDAGGGGLVVRWPPLCDVDLPHAKRGCPEFPTPLMFGRQPIFPPPNPTINDYEGEADGAAEGQPLAHVKREQRNSAAAMSTSTRAVSPTRRVPDIGQA